MNSRDFIRVANYVFYNDIMSLKCLEVYVIARIEMTNVFIERLARLFKREDDDYNIEGIGI